MCRKTIAVILISVFFIACQNSAETIPDDDNQAKAVLAQVNAELNSSRISPESFEKLKAIFEEYPNVAEVRKSYKVALILRDDLESLEKLLTVENLSEMSSDDRKNLARLYVKNGKYEKSSSVINTLIEENPNDLEVRGMKGLVLFNLGQLNEAGKEFDEVWNEIVKNKMSEEIATRGIIFYRQDRIPKAIETLRQALEADPNHISATYTLSRIYAAQGNTEQAEIYRQKTDELQNKLKAEAFEKSKNVKRSYELQNAWKEKRYQEVIELSNQMLPITTDVKQKTILYKYLFESYRALGNSIEAEKIRQEVQKLNTK